MAIFQVYRACRVGVGGGDRALGVGAPSSLLATELWTPPVKGAERLEWLAAIMYRPVIERVSQ